MTIAIFLGSLLGAMAIGMPIAFSLIICGIALMLQMDLFDSQLVAQKFVDGADNYPLLAVPFFMLAGEFMNAGGLSRRIVTLAITLVGHIRGGLGFVAIIGAVVMASMSGSALADTAALSAILIPMMNKGGYETRRSAGLIAAGGVIAPVLPPSMGFIIFGVISGVSITKLFFAGIVPGLMMATALFGTWAVMARKHTAPPAPRASLRQIGRAAFDGAWALVMPVIIVGGLKQGVFTPTEASVVAAVYALLVGLFVYRELKFRHLYSLFLRAGVTTSVVMFLAAAAMVSSSLITVADIPGDVVRLLEPFINSPTMLMFMMMLVVVAVGTAMDILPTILILTPVLMPLVNAAHIDPVYFGVLFIMNNAIGLITPPVGTVLNVACGVAKISMDDIMKGIWPFLLAELAVLFLLVLFPVLVTGPARFIHGQ
ncbi:MAG: dctM [Betaproteobacteria bacterium]|nr:dctM [Betaproteobacteria bacterium]